jgi:urease accessory protein
MVELLSSSTSPRLQRVDAEGRLAVKHTDRGSVIDRLYQSGSAKIRFPASPDSRTCEAVLINTAGGLTGGDRLSWALRAGDTAKLTCTSQACERIYRSRDGEPARMSVKIDIGKGARVNWIPQETILFDGCALERSLEADLAPDASLLVVEALVFGRAAMGETVRRLSLKDRWRIRRDGRAVFADAVSFAGDDMEHQLQRRAVAKGHRALATVALVAPDAERHLHHVRERFPDIASSAFAGKLLARLTANEAHDLRKMLIPLAELLSGENALPKVWAA